MIIVLKIGGGAVLDLTASGKVGTARTDQKTCVRSNEPAVGPMNPR